MATRCQCNDSGFQHAANRCGHTGYLPVIRYDENTERYLSLLVCGDCILSSDIDMREEN